MTPKTLFHQYLQMQKIRLNNRVYLKEELICVFSFYHKDTFVETLWC